MRLSPLIAAFLCALILPSAAQQAPNPAPVAPAEASAAAPAAPAAQPLTAENLEAWLDGYVPYALENGDIAGAVVVVVANGQVLFQKGYGYSNVENRTPVDPATTMFRPGSVSKLFTWTAVMQLVEQGRLDLDADVNTYLDFELPGEPVTMRNIMTHTPGYEERLKGLILNAPADYTFAQRMAPPWVPDQIFQPGTTPAYSNYATSLAGYIVQRVSGERFEDYIENHIFQPLGMTHSTFEQPLPENLQPFMSSGYSRASARQAGFYEIVDLNPAGGLAATGSDMARFMLAHLQDGALGDARILQAATAEQMHTTAYDGVPNVHQMLLGFYQRDINGRRVISHGGDTIYFHSDLSLFIDDGVGLFISMNSSGRQGASGPIRSWLFEQFADRYLPGPRPTGQVDEATAAEHARMMEGVYSVSRRTESSPVSAASILDSGTRVTVRDGTISVSGMRGINGAQTRWVEIAPFVWRDADGHGRLAAQVENGRVVRFAVDEAPFMVFDRVSGFAASGLLGPIVIAAFVILALTVIFWPVNAFLRWRYKASFPLAGSAAMAYRVACATALLPLVAVTVWFTTFSKLLPSEEPLPSDGFLIGLRIFTLVAGLAAVVGALWNAFAAWTSKERGWWSKLWSVLLTLAALVALAYVVKFHLVGFDASY